MVTILLERSFSERMGVGSSGGRKSSKLAPGLQKPCRESPDQTFAERLCEGPGRSAVQSPGVWWGAPQRGAGLHPPSRRGMQPWASARRRDRPQWTVVLGGNAVPEGVRGLLEALRGPWIPRESDSGWISRRNSSGF